MTHLLRADSMTAAHQVELTLETGAVSNGMVEMIVCITKPSIGLKLHMPFVLTGFDLTTFLERLRLIERGAARIANCVSFDEEIEILVMRAQEPGVFVVG